MLMAVLSAVRLGERWCDMEYDPETEAAERKSYKKESFTQAFDRHRKAGEKTFVWQGKEYTTEMAKPKPRPAVSDTYRKEGEGRGTPEAPKRAAIPGTERETEVEEPTRGSRFSAGLSDTAAKTLAALGAGAGVVGLASKMSKAGKAAEAARIAREESRIAPTMRRTGVAAEADRAAAREALTREPPMSRAASTAEKAAPAMQAEKARPTPRMRMRERDEEGVEFKRGGMVKPRGSGCARKGFGKGTMR